MDYTFLFAFVLGIAVIVFTYASPKAVFLRDGLGRGDTGNRVLLIMIPGLTLMSLGVLLFEVLEGFATGLSPWRVWGLPLAALLAVVGIGLVLWAFIPGPAPRWLQPKWMKEQQIHGALSSLARVERAQERRNRSVKRRGFAYFTTQVIGGVSVGYPENWVLNLDPAQPARIPGLKLVAHFAVDTPHDYVPPARVLVSSAALPGTASLADAAGAATLTESHGQDTVNWMRRLAVPTGWEVVSVQAATLAGAPGVMATTRAPAGKGVQQRWVTAVGDSLWVVAFQVGAPDFGDLAALGEKIVATLTLRDSPV